MPGSVILDLEDHRRRQLDADRAAIVEVDLHPHLRKEVAGLAFEGTRRSGLICSKFSWVP